MKHWLRHPSLTLALSAALALASGSAAALGLGQIEVRSRAGQPLLAEIPIVSGDPSELQQLEARLASPETFARIGLQPPQGAVADLDFAIGRDAAGRPVIRVTTQAPVTQPLLTFLVEVDWGQGRLVREYSALIDAPRAVQAPVQPPVEGPVATPPPVVQRPTAQARQTPATPQGPGAGVRGATGAPSEYGPVKRGESLSAITARLGIGEGSSIDQAMVALLRANPGAFIDGDINQLRQGAVLRVPPAAEVAAVDAAQASALVRSHIRQWRQARAQAASAAQAAAESPAPTAGTGQPGRGPQPSAGARLEIVPPAPGEARKAGTQSGTQAGGEGQMLRQELQQTKETLATREAELQELRSRVAELEKLQTDQQKLLQMRDSELAAAQQRLAASQQAAATTAQPAAQPTATPVAPSSSLLPWVVGAVALLALLVGGWWARRRQPARPAFRAPAASAGPSLADAFPARDAMDDRDAEAVAATGAGTAAALHLDGGQATDTAPPGGDHRDDLVVHDHEDIRHHHEPLEEAMDSPLAMESPVDVATGTGLPGGLDEGFAEDEAAADDHRLAFDPTTTVGDVETHDAGEATHEPELSTASLLIDEPPAAPVNERIELAQAYMDLGDHDSARQLLGEVVVTGDHASRQRAMRMLRDMG